MSISRIKVFAPATVANVGPGYDVFGLALEDIGDEIELLRSDEEGIIIHPVKGYEGIPTDPKHNVAGVVIQAMLEDLNRHDGFEMILSKNVLPGSGLGSSASSSAVAAYAANELLGKPYHTQELVKFAMEGERIASGKAHADNVAPSLLGGFTLVRSYDPLDVINLTFPEDIVVTVVHPQLEVKTADSKRILKPEIKLENAIKQWGNVAGLVSGLASGDYDLIGRSLDDVIVEPVRSILIPGFDEAKNAAINAGALGCSISGSGPSMFALTQGFEKAKIVEKVFKNHFNQLKIDSNIYVSSISNEGARIIT